MKRLLASILLVLFVFTAIPVTAYADGRTVHTKDLGLSVDLPGDYYVLCRDGSDADALSLLDMTQAAWLKSAEANNQYLDAFSGDFQSEVIITMTPGEVTTMNVMSEAALQTFYPDLREAYASLGYDTVDQDDCVINGQTYILTECKTADQGFIQYLTMRDDMAVFLTYNSYDGPLDSADRKALDALMDSLSFDRDKGGKKTDVKPVVYRDSLSGISLTLPGGWVRDKSREDSDAITAAFALPFSSKAVLFSAADYWSELPSARKLVLKRGKCDFSALSASELKDFEEAYLGAAGAVKKSAGKVTLGGVDFYRIEGTLQGTKGSAQPGTPLSMYLTMHNGYMLVFQIDAFSTEPIWADFEDLLLSLELP